MSLFERVAALRQRFDDHAVLGIELARAVYADADEVGIFNEMKRRCEAFLLHPLSD